MKNCLSEKWIVFGKFTRFRVHVLVINKRFDILDVMIRLLRSDSFNGADDGSRPQSSLPS